MTLTALAELHRARTHSWVKPGKCHRLELDAGEHLRVEGLLASYAAAGKEQR